MLEYLASIRDVRELAMAVICLCNEDGLLQVQVEATAVRQSLQQLNNRGDAITSQMLLVASLTHTDLTQPSYRHAEEPTALGAQCLERIAAAVLGDAAAAAASSHGAFIHALACSTTTQVLAARHLCLAALTASTNHHNCYALYRFAREAAIAPLRDTVERCCLTALPQMAAAWGERQQLLLQKQQGHLHQQEVQQQGSSSGEQVLNRGFAQLPQRQLEALLQSDALQVACETDVFTAVCMWVAACPSERRPQLADLVRGCVRCCAMELRELEALDQHPQVVESSELTRIVAQAYVLHIMGVRQPAGSAGPRSSVLAARQRERQQREQQQQWLLQREMRREVEAEVEMGEEGGVWRGGGDWGMVQVVAC